MDGATEMQAGGGAATEPEAAARPRIGVSACLLGAEVRYDGGHKRDPWIVALREHADVVPVCPEMELGLGAPRETMRLVRERDGLVRLRMPKSGRDLTDEMQAYATGKAAALAGAALDGFILKKDSPSCGLERVRLYDERTGIPTKEGRGLFAGALLEANPLLAAEEEGRLHDAPLRDNFLVRVYASLRLRRFFAGRWTLGTLVDLHGRSKLLLMAHASSLYGELGRLVAGGRALAPDALAARYRSLFLRALAPVPRVGHHVNVLQHMAGFFRERAPAADRAELREAIEEYACGRLGRAAPLLLLRHQARRHGVEYLLRQSYLDPYPRDFLRARD
jgi:uncharacterized protein YbbK (DUF523 family)/uncharacterized protein YbgA (DUF1722 family)